MEEIAPVLAVLLCRLQQRDSDYASILATLLALSEADVDLADIKAQIAGEQRDELVAAGGVQQVAHLGERVLPRGRVLRAIIVHDRDTEGRAQMPRTLEPRHGAGQIGWRRSQAIACRQQLDLI